MFSKEIKELIRITIFISFKIITLKQFNKDVLTYYLFFSRLQLLVINEFYLVSK